MPLPKPRKKEDKNEFISRCMSDDIMEAIRTGNFVYDLSGNAR